MKREFGWKSVSRIDDSVVTVGVFDGVHLGHRTLLAELFWQSNERKGISTVVSFDPHPKAVLNGESVELLTTAEERATRLEQTGLDRLVVIPFTRDFAEQEPGAYVRDFLVESIGMKAFVIGYDHHFGRNRSGDVKLLKSLGDELGFDVHVIPPRKKEDLIVSSSAIRNMIRQQDILTANRMLGAPYLIIGKVVPGAGRGRSLGFHTANIQIEDERKLVPPDGVYAVLVRISGEPETWAGMMNIGRRPTFGGGDQRVLEAHLFNFEGNLYGLDVSVELIDFLRPEQRFPDADHLKAQLAQDRLDCLQRIELLT